MAVIQTGAVISDIRGSVGGTTFQRLGSGLTMRNKPLPVGGKSFGQSNVKNANSIVAEAYNELTDEQRDLWQSFSDFCNGSGVTGKGRKSSSSGRLMYFEVNVPLTLMGISRVDDPVFTGRPDPIGVSVTSAGVAADPEEFTRSVDVPNEYIVFQISKPLTSGSRIGSRQYRNLYFSQAVGDTQDWFNAFQSVYGFGFQSNAWYNCCTWAIDVTSGRLSAKTYQQFFYPVP